MIIPIRPSDVAQSPQLTGQATRRTFGISHPTRRTFGISHPSRRTFGINHP